VVFHPEHPPLRQAAPSSSARRTAPPTTPRATSAHRALYRAEHFQGGWYHRRHRPSRQGRPLRAALPHGQKNGFGGQKLPAAGAAFTWTFGSVNGEDGKALKTRDGGIIRLKALLDEAQERSYQLVSSKNPRPSSRPSDGPSPTIVGVALRAIRRSLAENRLQRLCVRLGQDDLAGRQHSRLPALRPSPASARSFRKAGLDAAPARPSAAPPAPGRRRRRSKPRAQAS